MAGSGSQKLQDRGSKTVAARQLMTRSDKPINHATFHGPAKPFSTSLIHDFSTVSFYCRIWGGGGRRAAIGAGKEGKRRVGVGADRSVPDCLAAPSTPYPFPTPIILFACQTLCRRLSCTISTNRCVFLLCDVT